jgi:hypothetical protein
MVVGRGKCTPVTGRPGWRTWASALGHNQSPAPFGHSGNRCSFSRDSLSLRGSEQLTGSLDASIAT